MGRTAKVGLFVLMGLVVAFARLIEVEIGKARDPGEPPALIAAASPGKAKHPERPGVPHLHHTRKAPAPARGHADPGAPKPAESAPAASKAVPAQAPGPAPKAELTGVEWPKGPVYTVKRGETLGDIARKVLGSSRHWQRLFEANAARLKDPKAVKPGMRLVVPSKELSLPASSHRDRDDGQ